MIALLIGIAGLSIAVVVSAIIDPWPFVGTEEDDCARMMNAIALSG